MIKYPKILIGFMLIFSGLGGVVNGQYKLVEKNIPLSSDDQIELNLRFGDRITVRAWNSSEIGFKAKVKINNGKLNDAFLTEIIDGDGKVEIETDFDDRKLKNGREEDCPGTGFSSYTWHNNGRSVVCSQIEFEIRIPATADVILETISADIEINGHYGPLRVKSISGYVDITWPETVGAAISIKTVTGDAYSNLENISFFNRKKHSPLVGYELKGKIGEGGSLIKLESVSGDIFLRRKDQP